MNMEPTTKPKPFCFVLMPFASEFNDIYAFGIKGACDELVYVETVIADLLINAKVFL